MTFMPVARIVGAHGLKGYLKLTLLTDFPERLSEGSRLRLNGQWVTVRSTAIHQDRLMVQLAEVRDRTGAEALRGAVLEAIDSKPALDDDEFLVTDLIGCEVVTPAGRALGAVTDILPYPAQDVLAIGDIMIPFVKEFVKDIDLPNRRLIVEPLTGMLDASEAVE